MHSVQDRAENIVRGSSSAVILCSPTQTECAQAKGNTTVLNTDGSHCPLLSLSSAAVTSPKFDGVHFFTFTRHEDGVIPGKTNNHAV